MKLLFTQQPDSGILDIHDFSAWEKNAMPLGNGHFGAALFGRIDQDRIQITENSLCNAYAHGSTNPRCNFGLQSFCDIFFEFSSGKYKGYKRTLDLDRAIASLSYSQNDAVLKREAFLSYPDNVLAVRFSSKDNAAFSFKARLSLPFIGERISGEPVPFSRTGSVDSSTGLILAQGEMCYYKIAYCGVLGETHEDGLVTYLEDGYSFENVTSATLYFTCGTNYKLSKNIFLTEDPKAKLIENPNLHLEVITHLKETMLLGYENLKRRHIKDYQSLYKRVSLHLGNHGLSKIATPALVEMAKEGKSTRDLEELLFQFGRYLLISSSRKGGLPANLQGIWSAYDSSPWSAGYWHNINVQMNYWPSGPANLSETFLPYIDYFKAYLPKAKLHATAYLDKVLPNRHHGDDGWTIGTGGWPYAIEGIRPKGHSGPGTGGFTSLLFADYFDYTQDKEFLAEVGYPAIKGMSSFLEQSLIEQDGKYLIANSASPENIEKGGEWNDYHLTTGCAFDQQMVAENFKRTLEFADILELPKDKFLDRIQTVSPLLDPIIIGESGQVKEYREERFYADIGEEHHRHISQLVGLYPGTLFHLGSKEMDAAIYTLNARGDESTGWATAHRLCLWARTGNSKRAYDLVQSFVSHNVLPNLWDSHPPFQIDGNFGYVAGICEMLIQSHEGHINLLPCLPTQWKDGSFKGLKARGNFEVSLTWKEGKIQKGSIRSLSGKTLKIQANEIYAKRKDGSEIPAKGGLIICKMKKNETIQIIGK